MSYPYFNPRSHERSDKKSVDDGDMMSISIHAPTRGATLVTHCVLLHDIIFQSTLPREERQVNRFSVQFLRYFNPRSHERSDAPVSVTAGDPVTISIHAPTRGATAILHKKFVYFYTIPTINI